jgi:TPR repeat protein
MRAYVIVALILILGITIPLNGAKAQSPVVGEPPSDSSSEGDIKELQKKAEAGDSSAAFSLGHAYETGKGVHPNFQLAAYWYRNAAEWGNAAAQSNLGLLYWLGEGVDKDKKEAVKWYLKAARQGNANAMFNLGVAYYNGEGANVDYTRAYAWFLLASEAGSAAGQDAAKRSQTEHGRTAVCDAYLSVAEMYEKGVDLPRNLSLAEGWYRKAVKDHGCKGGTIRLASLFLNAGNYADALEWCKIAEKEGYSQGAFCLGHLYQQGLGVTLDLKAAFQWYDRATKRGNAAAMLALGEMYENGQATNVDRVEAMVLFIRASAANQEATAKARRLRAAMNEEEWKKTQQRLRLIHLDPQKIDIFLQGDGKQAAH